MSLDNTHHLGPTTAPDDDRPVDVGASEPDLHPIFADFFSRVMARPTRQIGDHLPHGWETRRGV